MGLRKQLRKVFVTYLLIWAFLIASLPLRGQSIVTSSSVTGGSSAFVFRKAQKARKESALPSRRSRAKRSTEQRKDTQARISRQSRAVAKSNRNRRSTKQVNPQDFAKIDVVELERKSPQEASVVFAGLAEYYIEREEIDKAILAYEQAVELDKSNKDALLGLSESYTRKGDDALEEDDYGKAKRYYDEAVKLDPLNPSAWAGRGQYYDSLDQDEDAKSDYLKALSLDPDFNQVKLPLGIIYYQEGEIAKSDELVVAALSGDANNAETQYFLGLIRYKQGRDAEAETALRKAIALDDSNEDAHYYLGAVLNRMGREKDAVKEFERATQLDDKYVPAWFDLGVAYYNQERWVDSTKAFAQAIKFNSNQTEDLKKIYSESYANMAEGYRQLEEFDKAVTNYRIAVSRIKDDAELYSNYGFVLGRQEKWKPAIENFKKAAELQSDAISYANLGWAYLNQAAYDRSYNQPRSMIEGSLREAKPALAKAVQFDPSFVAAYLNLGVVLNDLGEYLEAAKALEKANSLQKDWGPAMQELGVAYSKLGKYSEAIKLFQKVLKQEDKNIWALFYLGEAEYRSGDKKEARKIQQRLQPLSRKLANQLETILRGNA